MLGMLIALLLSILLTSNSCFAMKKFQDLSNRGLTDLSDIEIRNNIKKLSLSDNNLSSLEGLITPSTLEIFFASRNNLSNLNGATLNDSIRIISLSGNPIISINKEQLPPNLKELYLVDIGIESLNGFTFNDNLELLSLAGNDLKTFNGNDLNLNLSTLFIGNSDFQDYSKVFVPSSVRSLGIGSASDSFDYSDLALHNNLETLRFGPAPIIASDLETINLPPRLKELSFRFTNITNIDSLVNIPETLEVLDLRKCKITNKEKRRIRQRFKGNKNLRIKMNNQRL